MAHHRTTFSIIGALAVLLSAAAPALAGDYYDIILANRLIGRLRDPGPWDSVSQRGAQVEKNVVEALSVENVGSPRMSVRTASGRPHIYIGNTFLVDVRPGDVVGSGTSASALAGRWVAGFKQQFPRAEPVTKMGSGGSKSAGSGGTTPSAPVKKTVVVPEEDQALVEEVVRLLADTRAMPEEDFSAKSTALADETATLIWRQSAGTSACETLAEVEGGDKALKSTLNGLRFARDVPDDSFAGQSTLIALTIVNRVRGSLPTGQ